MFLIPVYTPVAPVLVYTVPPPSPPFVVASNVNVALFILINVSAEVALVTVVDVDVPSLAYTRQL